MWRLVLILTAAGFVSLAAQQDASPSLDDSGLLHGVIRSATEPSQRLRGARITIAHQSRPGGTVFSDHEGRFRIPAVAPGPYTLTVTKAGFAPETLTLASGAASGPLEIRMRPGAALTGQVLSVDGGPAFSVAVRAHRLPGPNATSFTSAEVQDVSTESDDRGEFRIGSLPPGRYEVRVEPADCQTVQVGSATAPVSCDLAPSRDAALEAPAVVVLEPGVEHSITLVTAVAPPADRRGSAVVATHGRLSVPQHLCVDRRWELTDGAGVRRLSNRLSMGDGPWAGGPVRAFGADERRQR